MAGISAALAVTSEDRAKLERLVRCGKTEQRVAFRSRIILKAAEGWSNSAIAEALGTSRPTVIDWRKRYEAEGMAGLSPQVPLWLCFPADLGCPRFELRGAPLRCFRDSTTGSAA